jgi:phosphoribosylformylglycinamidine synthase
LVEAHLLPGGLIRNEHQHFICRDQKLRVENNQTAWTSLFEKDQEITIPLKNGEGGYIATPDTIKMLEEENRVVFRYLDVNPNGSMNDIAGLTNERGNVVGLMPHPEHAVEPGFGPDRPEAMRSGTDGLKFFQSVITQLVRN